MTSPALIPALARQAEATVERIARMHGADAALAFAQAAIRASWAVQPVPPPMAIPLAHAARLRDEARAYPPGSPDHEYRRRAAWKLIQIANRVPAADWTADPPADFWAEEEAAA